MARGIVQEVEAVEEKPVAGVLMGMTGLGYLFILTALAAGIAWIVYVAKSHGSLGKNDIDDAVDSAPTDAKDYTDTIDVCFQAAVVSCLFYFVARHHFSNLHY
jgi:hypothetical protein